jgi:hypothetical protein
LSEGTHGNIVSAAVEGPAFAFAAAVAFPLHQPKTLVISERSEEPQHSLLPLLLRLLLLFSLRQNRHFDRSSSRSHRELRSGEIRFSTHASPSQRIAFNFLLLPVHFTRTGILHHDTLSVHLSVFCHQQNEKKFVILNVISRVIHNKRITVGFKPLKNLAAPREP